MGPGGGNITTNSRTIIIPTISNGNNTYISSLQLTYLKKRDEGNITCNVAILETTGSDSVEIVNITGKYLYVLMLI